MSVREVRQIHGKPIGESTSLRVTAPSEEESISECNTVRERIGFLSPSLWCLGLPHSDELAFHAAGVMGLTIWSLCIFKATSLPTRYTKKTVTATRAAIETPVMRTSSVWPHQSCCFSASRLSARRILAACLLFPTLPTGTGDSMTTDWKGCGAERDCSGGATARAISNWI